MIFALISGSLFKNPEERNSKAGRPFVSATLKVPAGEGITWVRVIAFSDTSQTDLLRLIEGDAVSVQGPLKVELYKPAVGDPKLSLSIVADLVLACRQPPKKRASKAREPDARSRQQRVAGEWKGPQDGPDDQVPF